MKVPMQLLSAGCGALEQGGLWSNVVVLDDEQHEFNDGSRMDKGLKTAKISVCTENENEVGKRLFTLKYPIQILAEVETSVKQSQLVMKIKNFSTNSDK